MSCWFKTKILVYSLEVYPSSSQVDERVAFSNSTRAVVDVSSMFCTLVPNIYKIQYGYTVSDTSRVVYLSAYLYNNVLFTFPVVCWRKEFLKWNLFYCLVSQLQPYGIFFSHMKRNLNMNVYCTVHNVTEMAVFFRNFKRLMRYLL